MPQGVVHSDGRTSGFPRPQEAEEAQARSGPEHLRVTSVRVGLPHGLHSGKDGRGNREAATRTCRRTPLRAFQNVLDTWHGRDVGAVHAAGDLTMTDGGEVAFDGTVGQVLAMQVCNEEEDDILRRWERRQAGIVAEREVAPYAGLVGFAS